MEKFYVYEYIDPRNNKVFYVGKGKDNRLYVHLQPTKLKENSPKSKLILEILSNGMEPVIKKKKTFSNETDALNYEMYLIAVYGIENLTNKTIGGQGVSGFQSFEGKNHTDSAKEKMREAQLGQKNSMAGDKWHRSIAGRKSFSEKMSGENHPQYGKPRSEKTKEIISKKCKGLKLTKKQKQTRSIRMKEVWKNRKKTGTIIKRHPRYKKYPGTIIYDNDNIKYVECLREFCDNNNYSFRVLYGTAKTKKYISRGKSKGMRFEPE